MAYTSLIRLEVRNSMRNMVSRREATSTAVAKAFVIMESDLNDGLLVERNLDVNKVLKVAEQLSSRRDEKHAIRFIDLLHVASAHVLEVSVFLTFDKRQALFARQTGLVVKP